MNTVFVCIVDEKGKVVRENEIPSTTEAISGFLKGMGLEIEKIGREGGNLTHYLKKELKKRYQMIKYKLTEILNKKI